MKKTSFINLFMIDQILNFSTMLSLFGVYLKCFGLTKLIPTVFYTNIYPLGGKYANSIKLLPIKAILLNDRLHLTVLKNAYLYNKRMCSPVTDLTLY